MIKLIRLRYTFDKIMVRFRMSRMLRKRYNVDMMRLHYSRDIVDNADLRAVNY